MFKFKKYLTELESCEKTQPNNEFQLLFQKVLNDEISAVILYQRLANEMIGQEFDYFRDQMSEHAKDELEHFNDLLEIAANRGISYTVNLTEDANLPITSETAELLVLRTQELETNAISDYKTLIKMCKELQEFELGKKFKEILEDEGEHFDDVAMVTGQVRPIAGIVNNDASRIVTPTDTNLNPVQPASISTLGVNFEL